MALTPYALPLRIRKSGESYFEDEPTRRGLVNRLSGADAKTLAQTIARALTAEAESKRIGEERP